MISRKLKLMKLLSAHLEGINPTETFLNPDTGAQEAYPIDLRDKVFRGRNTFGDEVKEPFLCVLEAPRQIDPNSTGSALLTQKEEWVLLVQGFAQDNKTNPTDPAYELLAFVQERLSRITQETPSGGRGGKFPSVFRLGGLAVSVGFQIPIVRPGNDDVSGTAYFYMPVSIGTVTDLSKPFIEGD